MNKCKDYMQSEISVLLQITKGKEITKKPGTTQVGAARTVQNTHDGDLKEMFHYTFSGEEERGGRGGMGREE